MVTNNVMSLASLRIALQGLRIALEGLHIALYPQWPHHHFTVRLPTTHRFKERHIAAVALSGDNTCPTNQSCSKVVNYVTIEIWHYHDVKLPGVGYQLQTLQTVHFRFWIRVRVRLTLQSSTSHFFWRECSIHGNFPSAWNIHHTILAQFCKHHQNQSSISWLC